MRRTPFGFLAGLLILLSAACGKVPTNSDSVYLGPYPIYKLKPGYKEVVPNSMAVKRYEQLFNYYAQYNVPLHRIVLGDSATIYLGLVVDPMPATLQDLLSSDSIWTQKASKQIGGGYLGLLSYRKGGYNVRYLQKSAKTKQVHAINLFTEDSATASFYYNGEKLFNGCLLL